jgi:hypothetical protein
VKRPAALVSGIITGTGMPGRSTSGRLGAEYVRRPPVDEGSRRLHQPGVEVELPGVAQVAIQSGQYAAHQVKRRLAGEDPAGPFKCIDKGSLATVSASPRWPVSAGVPAL